ncbi:unnamed protein product [Bemisia tabaci]|uniref:UDP-glucuronosyltransferase n=1 Tax=Bemisia tabaci TaxID=7038 RepID=A0A9P0F1X2_BEMTA|nr:unnamed protein product [Bemisia tabaci]
MKPVPNLKCAWMLTFLSFTLLRKFECYKILFALPMPNKSHFTTNRVLAEELVRRGHDVTVVTAFPQNGTNYREIMIDMKVFEAVFAGNRELYKKYAKLNPFESLIHRWNVIPRTLDVALSTDAMQSIIHSTDQYDVIMTDLSFYQSCIVALGHKFNAPVINISPTAPSSYAASVSGNPIPFSVVPSKWAALPGGMKFFDRVFNTLISSWDLLGEFFYVQPKQEILMRKHFTYAGSEDLPPLREMLQNVSITLVNSHFSLGIPRSYAPNMVEVGGFHIQPKKRLADNLERFMSKAKNGVAYVSFGTLVQPHHLSSEKLLLIISALRRLKLHVILKCDYLSDADLQNAEGVLLLHWAPQQEILAHPNCVLFVTHGGYNSLIEVTWAGVPVLCIPIFSDQFHNAQIFEESGVGKLLYQDQLTEVILAETVDSIIHDSK